MSAVHRKLALSVSFCLRKVDFPAIVQQNKLSAGKSTFRTQNDIVSANSVYSKQKISFLSRAERILTPFRTWYEIYYYFKFIRSTFLLSTIAFHRMHTYTCPSWNPPIFNNLIEILSHSYLFSNSTINGRPSYPDEKNVIWIWIGIKTLMRSSRA